MDEPGFRLDVRHDDQPLLLMIVGAAAFLGAVAMGVFMPRAVLPFAAGLGLVGAVLFRAGWKWRRTYATDEGLLRVRRGSRELVPWSEVEIIEPVENQDASASGAIALLRLYLLDGRRVTIRCKPATLDHRVEAVRAYCPHTFVCDTRSGEIHAPTEGDPEAITRRKEALSRRMHRRHGGVGLLWGVAALVCAAGAVAAALFAVRHGGFGNWSLAGVMALGLLVSIRSVALTIQEVRSR